MSADEPGIAEFHEHAHRSTRRAAPRGAPAPEATSLLAGSQTQRVSSADLQPGESYVSVNSNLDDTAAVIGPTSTYTGFAQGCAGSRPATRLVPKDTPRIGATLEVTLFDLPMDTARMIFGWERIGPIGLAPLGAPGCQAHVRLDAVFFLAGQNNQAKFELPIPRDPTCVGARFFNQAVVFDPMVGNRIRAVVSDAAEAIVGNVAVPL